MADRLGKPRASKSAIVAEDVAVVTVYIALGIILGGGRLDWELFVAVPVLVAGFFMSLTAPLLIARRIGYRLLWRRGLRHLPTIPPYWRGPRCCGRSRHAHPVATAAFGLFSTQTDSGQKGWNLPRSGQGSAAGESQLVAWVGATSRFGHKPLRS